MRFPLGMVALIFAGCLFSPKSERGQASSEIKFETEIWISRNEGYPDSLFDIEYSADVIEVEPHTRHVIKLTFEHTDGTFIQAYENDGFIPDSNVIYRWIIQQEIDKIKEKGVQAVFTVDGNLVAKDTGSLPE